MVQSYQHCCKTGTSAILFFDNVRQVIVICKDRKRKRRHLSQMTGTGNKELGDEKMAPSRSVTKYINIKKKLL